MKRTLHEQLNTHVRDRKFNNKRYGLVYNEINNEYGPRVG